MGLHEQGSYPFARTQLRIEMIEPTTKPHCCHSTVLNNVAFGSMVVLFDAHRMKMKVHETSSADWFASLCTPVELEKAMNRVFQLLSPKRYRKGPKKYS